MRMRPVGKRFPRWFGGGTSAAIMTLVLVACAKGTDSGSVDDDASSGDASRDVFVVPLPDPDSSRPSVDGGADDAPVDSSPTGTHVVINEIQTAGSAANDEIVELYNPTSSAVSLADWEVRYASNSGGAGSAGHKFAASASIAANGYLVLSGASWTSGMAAADGQLGLFDGAGTGAKLIDGVAYGTITAGGISYREVQAAPSPPSSGSIGRFPNGVDTGNNKTDFKTFAATTAGAPNK